jgi:predicted transcriptional regulator
MSIKPHWADAIMAGTKRVEFRRSRLSRPISHVVVYATSPVQRVVGYFEVDTITRAEPLTLWSLFSAVGEIEFEAFMRYYDGAEDGTAIGVGDVFELAQPLELQAVLPAAVPPQSYRYADAALIPELERLATKRPASSASMAPALSHFGEVPQSL